MWLKIKANLVGEESVMISSNDKFSCKNWNHLIFH